MTRLSPFALAGALIATSLSVLSVSPAQAAVKHVQFGDLDLSSDAGRTTMNSRIRHAASIVCHGENRDLSLAAACQRETMAQALVDLERATRTDAVQLAVR